MKLLNTQEIHQITGGAFIDNLLDSLEDLFGGQEVDWECLG